MKHTSAFMKVLLLALCLVLALSALTACGDSGAVETLQNDVNQNKDKIEETVGKLDDLTNNSESKATVAALRALVEEVKATADGAATAAKLEELATSLTATAGDAAATAAALAEAKTTLETLITEGDAALTANVATVLGKVNALADAAATKVELGETVAAIEELLAVKADDEAVAAEVAKLVALVEANANVDAETKAALEASVAELVEIIDDQGEDIYFVIDDIYTAINYINGVIGDLATRDELSEAMNWIADLVVELEARVDERIDSLYAEYVALAESFTDANASIRAELDLLYTKIESMKAPVFVDDYKAATELLMDPSSEYSIFALRDIRATYVANKAMYVAADYEQFMNNLDLVEFYLMRATSVAEIESLFDDTIAALIEEIEKWTWRDHFPELLESFKGNVTPTTDIDFVAEIYDALPVEVQEANAEEYAYLKLAKAALEQAAEFAAVIDEEIAVLSKETIVYLVSATAVENVRAEVDALDEAAFVAAETDYPEIFAYYGVAVEDLFANYDALVAMEDRIAELDEAYAAIPEIIDVIADYNTARPLFSDFDAINANLEEVKAWIDEYTLEDENVLAMVLEADVYDAFANIEDAWYYADAMKGLYTYYVAEFVYGDYEGLNETINALIAENDAKAIVLSKHEAVAEAVREFVDALAADIAGTYQYDAAIDGNFAAMITADLVEFAKVEERIFGLNALKVYIPTLIAEVADLDANALDFADYDRINNFRVKLDAAYEVYAITVDDANYVELATEAEARYDELKEGYNKLTAKVREVYLDAMSKLEAYTVKMPLAAGNVLIEVVEALRHIVVDLGLTSVNLYLGEDDTGTEANIAALYATFIDLAVKYGEDAEEAVLAAEYLSLFIAGLGSAADLNNYEDIIDAYDLLLEWFKDYTDADLTEAGMLEALDVIKEINKFDDDVNTIDYYVFLSVDDFEDLCALNAEAIATYEAAEEASEGVLEKITADDVNDKWNIHSDFKSVYEAYVAFVDEFYAGSLTIDVDFFGVLAAMEDGKVYYDEYVAAVAVVESYAELVNDLIDALPTGAIAMEDGAYWFAYVMANFDVIDEFFNATKCEYGCEKCVEEYLDADPIDVVRVAARAYMADEYYKVYVTADAVNKTKIEVAKTLYDNMLNTAKSEAAIELVLTTALNKLDDYTI